MFRPHTTRPTDINETCLIAVVDDDDPYTPYLLDDLYTWDGEQMVSEDTGRPVPAERYWWLCERELFAAHPLMEVEYIEPY